MKHPLHFINIALIGVFIFCTAPAMAAPSSGSEDKESKIDSARPNYIEFPQMMSTVLDGYRVQGMVVLGFGLEIEDKELREKTRKLLPRLQDKYTRELNRYAGTLYRFGELPDAQLISKRMQFATDQMLGEGNAIFLISNLMVRGK